MKDFFVYAILAFSVTTANAATCDTLTCPANDGVRPQQAKPSAAALNCGPSPFSATTETCAATDNSRCCEFTTSGDFWIKADGASAAHTTEAVLSCGATLATTTSAGGTRAYEAGTATANAKCAPCAAGSYRFGVAPNAGNCLAHTTCGKQVGDASRLTGASATTAGACNTCAVDTWALTIADDCVANTVCGFAVGTSGALRVSPDASRTVAGTCAACAAGFWAGDSADCAAHTVCAGTTDGGTTARAQVNAPTVSIDRTCTECDNNFWAADGDNTNCAANTVCGTQIGGATRLTGDTRTTAGTCANCAANTFATSATDNCVSSASSAVYSIVTSGTCGSVSGRVDITDKATCESAARNLGVLGTGVWDTHNPVYPSCFVPVGAAVSVVYNSLGSTTVSCSSTLQCLCAKTASSSGGNGLFGCDCFKHSLFGY